MYIKQGRAALSLPRVATKQLYPIVFLVEDIMSLLFCGDVGWKEKAVFTLT